MAHLWTAARWLGDALFAPFAWMPPLAGLISMSVVWGGGVVLLFRLVSPQQRLQRVKDLMSATIYEMRLFSAYPGHLIKAQGRAIVLTVRYLALALPSFVVLIPVMGLLLVRAALVYEVQPLPLGQRARVGIILADGIQGAVEVEPRTDGLRVVPPVVSLDGQAHVRVEGAKPGRHALRIIAGNVTVEKEVAVGAVAGAVSPERSAPDRWQLTFSREPALEASDPVRVVTVNHPLESFTWLGLPWWLHFFIISMVVALALRRRLGVVF